MTKTKMASAVRLSGSAEGYWQSIVLKFRDGFQATVRLDAPTIAKLEAGDDRLMETIRKNLQKQQPSEISRNDNQLIGTIIPNKQQCAGTITTNKQQSATEAEYSENSDVEETIEPTNSCWSREAIHLLISLYQIHEEALENPSNKKKHIWKIITETMQAKGYCFKQSTVESKWRNLLQSHKDVRNNNSKSGKKRKTFQYFDNIEEIVAKRHDINPVFLAGSHCQDTQVTPRKVVYRAHKETDETSNDDTSPSTSKSTKRKRKSEAAQDTGQQLLEFIKEKEERLMQYREEKERRKDERAKDRNDLLRELINKN